jgi:alkanesulfonate monooxygenase SsuD/methylene tetrahydromethanopterin reductase-like flavin-dependent oxidoreductase (luciferase family)
MRATDLVALCQHAERAGLDAVGVGEFASTDAFALAAAIAASTERIRIETSIVTAVSRSAALMGMAAATVADLSNGRFVLGIGAGTPVVAVFHGTTLDHPLTRMRETLASLRDLSKGGRLDGSRFELRMPLPSPFPIVVSAVNPGMLRLAATQADGVYLSVLSSPRMVRRLAADAAAARPAGAFTPFEVLAIQHGVASSHAGAARKRMKREIAAYFTVPTYRAAALELVGEDELARVAEIQATGSIADLASWVPAHAVDQLFAAGPDLAGRVEELRRAGATGVRFNPVTITKGDVRAAMELVDELAAVRRSIGSGRA